jgi:hypothetical protein
MTLRVYWRLSEQFDEGRAGSEKGGTARHAGHDQLPGCESDFLTLAIVICEHLIDVGELLADIDLFRGDVGHWFLWSLVVDRVKLNPHRVQASECAGP